MKSISYSCIQVHSLLISLLSETPVSRAWNVLGITDLYHRGPAHPQAFVTLTSNSGCKRQKGVRG